MGLSLELYKIPKTKKKEIQDIIKRLDNDLYYRYGYEGNVHSELLKLSVTVQEFSRDGWVIIDYLNKFGIEMRDDATITVEIPFEVVNHLVELKQKLQIIIEDNPQLTKFEVFKEFPLAIDNGDNYIYVVSASS